MKKFAAIYRDSYRELKNVRTITTVAMFMAISMVLRYFTLDVGPFLKIGFASVANQFVYYLFGPVVGGFFGLILDLVMYVIKPTGAFFPGFTFNAVLAGILYGTFLYKRPISFKRVLFTHLLVIVVCNLILTPIWLKILYGQGMLAMMPVRILKNVIQWPVDSVIFYAIAKKMEDAGFVKAIRKFQISKVRV